VSGRITDFTEILRFSAASCLESGTTYQSTNRWLSCSPYTSQSESSRRSFRRKTQESRSPRCLHFCTASRSDIVPHGVVHVFEHLEVDMKRQKIHEADDASGNDGSHSKPVAKSPKRSTKSNPTSGGGIMRYFAAATQTPPRSSEPSSVSKVRILHFSYAN
jgi:hypothetical protein